jgi:hypothetical protein
MGSRSRDIVAVRRPRGHGQLSNRGQRSPDPGAERAVLYARCKVFEDLAYGLETGADKYVDKGLAAMAWLFPA